MPEVTGFALPEVFEWLYETLSGDATLAGLTPGGFHEHPAPEGTAGDRVTYQLQAPRDVDVVGSHRVLEELLVLVRVIGDGRSTKRLQPAADRLDVLLQRASGTTEDARILNCRRLSTFWLPEVSQGKHYRHLGGIYEILAQPLNA